MSNSAIEQAHQRPFDAKALRHVHFVAIGGTGMGSLAGLLKARGIHVTGSDKKLYPPMSIALEDWGIDVVEGFAPENVLADRPDLVVIGNAVRPDNEEAIAAIESGLPFRSFSDALYELAISKKHCITVSGTHGKTTTTNLVAHLLLATGRDPSLLVGGISLDFDGSFREGAGDHFVVEGDEYDTAFFDKTPKFLHYHPDTLILTSVEFDHADIYRDLDHVKSAFRELVRSMPADGQIVAAWNHEGVRDVAQDAVCDVIGYGVERVGQDQAPEGARWWASNLTPSGPILRFDLEDRESGRRFEIESALFGAHNVENIVGVLAVLDARGVPLEEAIPALRVHQGVKRRQEIRGQAAGVTVIDDFAHHPTAVAGTIQAIAQQYGGGSRNGASASGGRIVALLEPRTNTSRRALFQDDYIRALEGADRIAIAEVGDDPIYSATGEVTECLSAEAVASALRERGRDAVALAEVDAIVDWVVDGRKPGDTVLVMSNGAFGGIWEKLLTALDAADTAADTAAAADTKGHR
jgi:UDP-N-acetylmuramate: L-alanyl-gamma-D-glutamyl-meso-diaminopimelate ligase